MSSPSVSVIIPTYNRGDLIGETIENMLGQSLAPHELIVVDDGSSDQTVEVVRRFGDRVRLIEQARAGPGAARNAGLAVATGEYVQFFDSDDLCSRDKIERQATALAQSGADVAYGPWTPVWLEAGQAEFDGVVRQQSALRRAPLRAFLWGWLTLIPCCVIRRDLMVRLGGYPSARSTGEDVELLFRLILSGARFEHVPGPIVLVRQHTGGQISAAPELASMRASDRVHLTQTVWTLLNESDGVASVLDRYLWRTEMWSARKELERLTPVDLVEFNPAYALTRRVRQIVAGLRARRTGSRLPSDYTPGAMTPAQITAAHELGYRTVRP